MLKALRQMRHKIIWKIMLIFWLTTICIIVANILITTEIVVNENKVDRLKDNMSRLASEAVGVYESSGHRALNAWYKQVNKRYGLRVLLFNSSQRALGENTKNKSNRHHPKPNTFFNERRHLEKLRSIMGQPYQSASGESYYLKLLPSRRLEKQFRPSALLHVSRIGISFIFIFIGSWWIARSVSRPVNMLTQASREFASGKLKTRVAPEIGSRKDELGELAKAFDHMAERITDLLASQRQLFSDISHDIRTPLTRQKLAIELARESDDPSPMLDKLEDQNQIIETLLDNLLSLLRLEDAAGLAHPEPLNMADLLALITDHAELEASSKHVQISKDIQSNLKIIGQRDLMLRALENLLSNAIKYTPEGSTVSMTATQTSNNIELVISDEGPGIPDDQLERVIEPFYRTDQSRSSQNGGYGLGLSISNKIIQQHGGTLILENRVRDNQKIAGLKVTVLFPAEQET